MIQFEFNISHNNIREASFIRPMIFIKFDEADSLLENKVPKFIFQDTGDFIRSKKIFKDFFPEILILKVLYTICYFDRFLHYI